MLRDVERAPCRQRPGDADLRARIATFDVARGMMREAPEVLDAGRETPATLACVRNHRGDTTSFGYQCLIARRLIERGVRVVELIDTGSNNNWDAHGNMQEHRPKALRVDRAIAALIRDLKARGLLDSDAGRHLHRVRPDAVDRRHRNPGPQPLRQGVHGLARRRGREGGLPFGETDEFGINIVAEPGARPRLSRDDPAPDGHRPHAARLSLRRPRLSADRRRRERDQGDLERACRSGFSLTAG